MSQENESDITDVLKALNHEIRREIIRILHEKQIVPYSDFLDTLDLPASSNVAYHLSLLTKAQLIKKNDEGKYSLTHLGRRSALLINLAKESRTTTFSDIYLAFSRLNSVEILLGTWYIFFFAIGVSLTQTHLFIGLLFILMSIGSIFLFVYRTKTLWTLLLLNNFIWIFFVPSNRKILISIILSNVCGIILLIPDTEFIVPIAPYNLLLGWSFLLISFIFSGMYLYFTSGRDLRYLFSRK